MSFQHHKVPLIPTMGMPRFICFVGLLLVSLGLSSVEASPQSNAQSAALKIPKSLTLVIGNERQSAHEIATANGIGPQHPGYQSAVTGIELILKDFAKSHPTGGSLPANRIELVIRENRKVAGRRPSPDATPRENQRRTSGFKWPGSLTLVPGAESEAAREILVNNGLTPDKPGFADAMRKVDALLKGFAVKAPAGGKLPTTDLER
ncbi:MAG: hypothetical protein V2B18_05880, partial [Pseudomonadota bacterium]